MIDYSDLRKQALLLALEGIKAADPEQAVKRCMVNRNDSIEICGINFSKDYNFYIIGAGKASGNMALAVEEILEDNLVSGIVTVPEEIVSRYSSQKIEFLGSTHPYPSDKSVYAAERIIDFVKELPSKSLLISLFSGGGSALIEKPVDNVTIKDIAKTSSLLMKAGADIYELNTVRKHLSKIKGGWLAKHAFPISMISLLISDVVGDRIDVIASGPTAPDKTTFEDALRILKRYNLEKSVPRNVIKYLYDGVRGLNPETPKPNDRIFENVKIFVVASNIVSLNAMKKKAEEMGYKAIILTSRVLGEAKEIGKLIAGIGIEVYTNGNPLAPPAILLAGGETTVTVKGDGIGGRNQELALSAALMLQEYEGIVIASIGSDGRDGPTDAAGAIVDCNTIRKAYDLGLNPRKYLDNNDSYSFFEKVGGLIKTGYTGTNVNDFIIILVKNSREQKRG
ncbi:MAG: glycerate kinase [Thermoproteales archaeon]|nr:glycerate kinase [Thermoproteales archaeon]